MDSHRLILITASGIYKLHDMICVMSYLSREGGEIARIHQGLHCMFPEETIFGLSLEKESESQSQLGQILAYTPS